jgi:acetyltransferase-like isoleucine patch superfamily enzyme
MRRIHNIRLRVRGEKEANSVWKQRVSRWRLLPQQLGRWWWWMWINMQLSDLPCLGRFFVRLAGLPLGPYRKKWPLARIKPYLSPKAQIACTDLHLAPGCFIDDFVTIYSSTEGGGSVILDRDVYIHRGTIIEVGQGGKVIIGRGTHIQANCSLNGYLGNIRIGQYVMIAPTCGFFPYQHKMDDLSQPMCQQDLISKGDIVIEDDVWLGAGAKVMDGVHIGQGAVIGAGAVVTQDIPAFGIALGVPAHVVRTRLSADAYDVAQQRHVTCSPQ